MYISCAGLHKFWCITACRNTQFNVNSHMRKSVFPGTRICAILSELPHVEIHKIMCKSSPVEIRYSPCENSHQIVHIMHVEIHQKLWISKRAEILIFWCISAEIRAGKWISEWQFTSGFVNSWKTCGNTRFFGDIHMRKYTRKCEFPRAEIHAERRITACGNTLNQVQKIVPGEV